MSRVVLVVMIVVGAAYAAGSAVVVWSMLGSCTVRHSVILGPYLKCADERRP